MLGGTADDYANGCASAPDGSIYVVGRSLNLGSQKAVIAKFTKFGELIWQKQFGGTGESAFSGVAVDSSGDIYVTGFSASAGVGGNDMLTVKYDSAGTVLWQRTIGGTSSDDGNAVAIGSDGGVYVTGVVTVSSYRKMLTVKYNSSGVIQWQRQMSAGASVHDQGRGIACTSDGFVYVTGGLGSGSVDFILVRYTNSGALMWQQASAAGSTEVGHACAVDSTGNVYSTGYVSGGHGSLDILLTKYNPSAVVQWQKFIGGPFFEIGNSLTLDADGNLYVCGYTAPENGGGSVSGLIIKCDTAGNILWQRSLGSTLPDSLASIVVDSDGALVVCGSFASTTASAARSMVLARLPADGSLTGIYGPLTYAETTLGVMAGTMTLGAGAATGTIPSHTQASPMIANGEATLALSPVPVGGAALPPPPFALTGNTAVSASLTASLGLSPYGVGDLVILCARSSAGSMNVPAGWTNMGVHNSTRRCHKILEAGDLATLSLTFSASGNHAVRSMVVKASTFDPAVAPVARTRLAGLDPESPSTTPLVDTNTEGADFANRHNLVIAFTSWAHDTAGVTGYAYPNTNGNTLTSSGSPRQKLASCSQPFYGQESPAGQFTLTASASWNTFAFSIAGVAPLP